MLYQQIHFQNDVVLSPEAGVHTGSTLSATAALESPEYVVCQFPSDLSVVLPT